MKRLLLLVLAVLVFLLVPAVAHGAILNGKYLQTCNLANTGQIDPMVSPGAVADHPHAEAGAKTWTSTSTTADFLAGGTSCFNPTNFSAYWISPREMPDGSFQYPTHVKMYYGGFGADTTLIAGGKVFPYAQGDRFLIGDSKSKTMQSPATVFWRCDQAGQPALSAPPTTCPPGVGEAVVFNGPNCWNGRDLDSPDHRSHMMKAAGGGCPAGWLRVPMIQMEWHFPAAAVGGCPASDHGVGPCGHSEHTDVWEAQDALGQALETQCVNDPARDSPSSPLCGLFTFAAGNGWISNLNAWTAKLDYIAAADGNPV